ncbi:DUF4296 domain-containing protein [Hymenobacter sp. UV11]|uniref:DUF4296 domain-containing protein n=1 Tax=Hymenobacter sp. UV11 TaxID=1849735 RepID=UPI0014150C4C|nr:DUF4296 domain-containing protein [Hymenobacter sp. UV11]
MKSSLTQFVLALGLLLATGCARPEQVPTPPNLLPKEKMTSLLVQIHLLEARVETSRLPPDSARALFLSQQRDLMLRNGVSPTDSVFERSYRYYASHAKDLDGIYAGVIDSLSQREKKMDPTRMPRPN